MAYRKIRGGYPGAPNVPVEGANALVGLSKYLAAASRKKGGRDTFLVLVES